MTDFQDKVASLKEEWEVSKAQEDRTKALITGLFEALDISQSELKDAKVDLDNQKNGNKAARRRLDDYKTRVENLEHEKTRHAFVLVLIDGDCMPFKDELVKQGVEGGKRTAYLLKQAVEDNLRSPAWLSAAHVQIMTRVYANVKGLGKTYKDSSVLPRSECLDEFIRGFNMGDVLCDYVDAGNGKECSDEKVKAVFKLFISNVHCRRIYFGGSADNGYARLLGPYLETPGVSDRVCLLEGPPFARELCEIVNRFDTATFSDVFRDEKLLTLRRCVPWSTTSLAKPSMNYAAVASRPPSSPSPAAQHRSSTSPPQSSSLRWGVLRNATGQRVDSVLNYTPTEFHEVKSRKLCNRFHLLDKCLYDTGCHYKHGDRLSLREQEVLLGVSRLTPCSNELWCDDPKCIWGHRCTRRDCQFEDCKFSEEMHDVDTQIVN